MANEGTLTINASCTKSGTTLTRSLTNTFNVSSAQGIIQRQNIGTADETLALGDVATPGFFVACNRDATNYLEIGHTSGTYSIKLKAGELCAFRVGSAMASAIHAKANTAACDLEYFLLPD